MMQFMQWFAAAATDCSKNLFFGVPNWSTGLDFDTADCSIKSFNPLVDIWLVVANVARMALAAAALLAVIFMIVGAVSFMASRGEPENTKKAISIMANSIAGLVIAILASAIVGLIAGAIS